MMKQPLLSQSQTDRSRGIKHPGNMNSGVLYVSVCLLQLIPMYSISLTSYVRKLPKIGTGEIVDPPLYVVYHVLGINVADL